MTIREDLSGEQHIAFFDRDPLLATISVFPVSINLKVSFEQRNRNGDEKKKNPFSFLTPLKASTHLKSECLVYVTPAIRSLRERDNERGICRGASLKLV